MQLISNILKERKYKLLVAVYIQCASWLSMSTALKCLVLGRLIIPLNIRHKQFTSIAYFSASFNCSKFKLQSIRHFSRSIKMDDDYDPSVGLQQNGVEKKPKGGKRLSVERIYQKKSQLEHILLRPDTYIGSVQPVTEKMWVLDEVSNQFF